MSSDDAATMPLCRLAIRNAIGLSNVAWWLFVLRHKDEAAWHSAMEQNPFLANADAFGPQELANAEQRFAPRASTHALAVVAAIRMLIVSYSFLSNQHLSNTAW